MITLYFDVGNINSVITIYNQIEIIRYRGVTEATPETPTGEPDAMTDWTAVSGTIPYTAPIPLSAGVTDYYLYDSLGNDSDYYSTRFSHTSDVEGINSGWSTPMLGNTAELYVDPMYPSEIPIDSEEELIIDRLRLLIGDPLDLKREFGEDATYNFHDNGYVYEMEEKGWPASINMAGTQYTSLENPNVNGYKYLKFTSDVSAPVTVSGVTYSVDLWYYTFRHSDKQLLDIYDNTPPPLGLTTTTTTSEIYMLAAAVEIVRSELFLDSTESGIRITDDKSSYDPSPGLDAKRRLLDDLQKQLKAKVDAVKMTGISGVLID